jgi:hypothetical protein
MQTESSKTDPPKRKRRWFQFSLRTLLVVMAILAVGCAWVAGKIEQSRREREATRHFLALGAVILQDQQPMLSRLWPFGEQMVTTGVLVGNKEYYLTFGTARFAESMEARIRQPTDSDLRRLKDLPGLETLRVTSQFVTDNGIAELVSIKSLRRLEICAPLVSNSAVVQIAQMVDLADLNLVGTAMTPSGIGNLRQLLPRCHVSIREAVEIIWPSDGI